MAEILGGDAQVNAEITRNVLEGMEGPCRNVVLLNAAPALVAGGLVDTLKEGVERARYSIDSGAALEKLNALVAFTNRKDC
jgi:anthranilate phosphoribosyltransferase